MTGKNGNNGGAGGDDDVGYRRPPKSGQIKPGEVRNPWGRTGKQQRPEDLLLKVAAEHIPASVNGRSTSMNQEEATYRRVFQEALKGNPTAMKLVLEHLSRRRPPLSPHSTMEELAQQAADEERKKELSKTIVDALERMAAIKGSRPRVVRYGPDGRPIGDGAPDKVASPGSFDEPVEKSSG